ncbi:hypothetical protein B0E45_01225 [Sinorhizobium sp. A49]|uniref:hypothetical protein n=1 Tax=Sinorhizobium sp. A49 TaxID=1945861 RepID=UPI000986063A|nr:hypothetical protein [Sinorhizobium sp. A49]OOG75579.1 hypothetical protein B0E45_01225 [Sinorhizobium sp. A49]
MAMVTRYSIQDEVGRFLTIEGSFAYDDADAAEFRDEDEAYEELAAYPGCTVETYQRFSAFPDLITTRTFSIERSAA